MDDGPGIISTLWRCWARGVALGCALSVVAGASAGPAAAQDAVDLELVLAVDASGSVDAREFELQTRGLALAFRDPEVIAALAAYAPAGVAVALVQWSGRRQEIVVVDWALVRDAVSAESFARAIEAADRWLLGETAIADALAFAVDMLEQNRFAGARRVVDISGDGPTNSGADPDPVRDAAAAAGITINGLAILDEIPVLDLYYAEHVIGGPDAFLVIAKDFEDFARAIRRKLLREIQGAPVARRDAPEPVLAAGE